MASLSRKKFIGQASVSVAAVGAVAVLPGFAVNRGTALASAPEAKTTARSGAVLAHVRNAATGEIAVMYGAEEVVIYDREVANRLMRATQ